MNSNTTQVGGNHYKGTTYQHWDFVMIALGGRYLEGNITKYITRHRKKNGLQDLQKARHYLTKLIELYNLGDVEPIFNINYGVLRHQSWEHFCDVNGVDVTERMIVQLVSTWRNREELHKAGTILDALIEKEQYANEDERGRQLPLYQVDAEGPQPGAMPVDSPVKVLLPFECTDAMKQSVSGIVSGYAAGKIWDRMRDIALFGEEPGRSYVNQG